MFQIKRNIEPIFWIAGLVFLALQNPASPFSSMCLFDFIGIKNCLGCGIGTSISYLFDGNIMLSIQTHYLGIPAVMAIAFRLFEIGKMNYKKFNNKSLSLG